MILASILCALVVVMTVVPYTGYISIGGVLEITTLHIVTILAGVRAASSPCPSISPSALPTCSWPSCPGCAWVRWPGSCSAS